MNSKIIIVFIVTSFSFINGMFTRLPLQGHQATRTVQRAKLAACMAPRAIQKRGVSTVERLKICEALPEQALNVSLALGAARYACGVLEKMYEVDSDASGVLLTKALYFKRQPGERIKPSELKSNPAYSLTPSILGLVMGSLEANIINEDAIHDHIVASWRKEHVAATHGDPITKKKVEDFMSLITRAYTNDKNNARSILLSFLYAKAQPNNNDDSIAFFENFSKYRPIDDSFKDLLRLSVESYTPQDYDAIVDNLKGLKGEAAVEYVKNNFAGSVAAIINKIQTSSLYPPAVIPSKYGYQGKTLQPNCVEAALQDLFNILVFNPQLQSFDLSLLPEDIKLDPLLVEFYSTHNSPSKVNYPHVGQAFMDMVSNIEGVCYRQSNYELIAKSTERNIITLANYLCGIYARSLADLADLLSDHRRQITLTLTGQAERKITLEMNNLINGQQVTAVFHFSDIHSWLETPLRNKTTHDYVSMPLNDYNNSTQIQALFSLQSDINILHHLNESMPSSFYYALNAEHDNDKFLLARHILMTSADDNEATDYAYHLYTQLSPKAQVQVFSLIMQSGVWKVNKKFENIYAILRPENDEERVCLIEKILNYNNANQAALDCLYSLYKGISLEYHRATVFKLILELGLHKKNDLFKDIYKTLDFKDIRSKNILINAILLHDNYNEEAVRYAYSLIDGNWDQFLGVIMKSDTWRNNSDLAQFFALNTYRSLEVALGAQVFNENTIKALYDCVDDDKKSRMLTLTLDAMQHAFSLRATRIDANKTALISEESFIDIVKMLLSFDCNVNASSKRTDSIGMTPLLFAIKIDNAALIELLIDHGADIHEPITSDCFSDYLEPISLKTLTPLHYAVKKGCINAVEVLLKRGVDVNMRNSSEGNNYITPLIMAILEEKSDIVGLLLKYGTDPNLIGKIKGKKISPLNAVLIRLKMDNDKIVAELIKSGADVNAIDDENNTVLDKALDIYTNRGCWNSIDKTIRILESAGAKARKAHQATFFMKSEQFEYLN